MSDKLIRVKVVDVKTTDLNPREHFDKKDLEELGASIKEQGLVQPIVVRPKGKKYELAVGERRLRAAARASTRKARVPKGEKHVPTMPAWWFSKATKREWAEALLERTADLITDIEVDYSGITLTMDDINVADLSFKIVPVDIVDGETDLKTMITMGEYRSTRSQQDNVARGDEVPVVTEVLGKLLAFQRKHIGVKQNKKETMIRECNGLKLGDRVKISKTCLMSSYRGAGADIVGFDDRENAVLNYSKSQKVVGIGDLEVVVKKEKPTS